MQKRQVDFSLILDKRVLMAPKRASNSVPKNIQVMLAQNIKITASNDKIGIKKSFVQNCANIAPPVISIFQRHNVSGIEDTKLILNCTLTIDHLFTVITQCYAIQINIR